MGSREPVLERVRRVLRSRWVSRACTALFVVSVPLALIGTNVRLLFGAEALYTFPINRYKVETASGIPRPELLRATREVHDYLFNSDKYLNIQVTDVFGNTGPLFSEREIVHMYDVKRLVQRIFRVQEVALLVAIGYAAVRLLLFRREGARGLLGVLWLTGLGVNVAGIAFGIGALLGFDELFTRFHTLSFSNDFWQLDPRTDHLVQMYPFQFWQITAGLLVGLTLAESALLALGARWGLSRMDGRATEDTEPSVPAETEGRATEPV